MRTINFSFHKCGLLYLSNVWHTACTASIAVISYIRVPQLWRHIHQRTLGLISDHSNMTAEDSDADQLEAHLSSSRHSGAQLLETKTNNNKQFSKKKYITVGANIKKISTLYLCLFKSLHECKIRLGLLLTLSEG